MQKRLKSPASNRRWLNGKPNYYRLDGRVDKASASVTVDSGFDSE